MSKEQDSVDAPKKHVDVNVSEQPGGRVGGLQLKLVNLIVNSGLELNYSFNNDYAYISLLHNAAIVPTLDNQITEAQYESLDHKVELAMRFREQLIEQFGPRFIERQAITHTLEELFDSNFFQFILRFRFVVKLGELSSADSDFNALKIVINDE